MDSIIQEAKSDIELQNTINIQEIIEKEKNIDHLEGKTLDSITQEIFDIINSLNILEEKKKEWCEKLIGYRFINEIYELHKGKDIKTLATPRSEVERSEVERSPILKMKGKVINIKFLNNGTHVVSLIGSKIYCQYRFDDYYTFQKLSLDEQIILKANDYILQK